MSTQHVCHATNCQLGVPEIKFMCRRHWFLLTKRLRDDIWDNYIPGQEIRKDPSPEYLTAARKAIEYIEKLEVS